MKESNRFASPHGVAYGPEYRNPAAALNICTDVIASQCWIWKQQLGILTDREKAKYIFMAFASLQFCTNYAVGQQNRFVPKEKNQIRAVTNVDFVSTEVWFHFAV